MCIMGFLFFSDLDRTLFLSGLLLLTFWDHQNFIQKTPKRTLAFILFWLMFLGVYSTSPFVKSKRYLQSDKTCPNRHWLLSFKDARYFNLSNEKVQSIHFVDLDMIPHNLDYLLKNETIRKNLYFKELKFLDSEKRHASDKLEFMRQRKCIGLYARGAKNPLKEERPFSRTKIFYEMLKENTILLYE